MDVLYSKFPRTHSTEIQFKKKKKFKDASTVLHRLQSVRHNSKLMLNINGLPLHGRVRILRQQFNDPANVYQVLVFGKRLMNNLLIQMQSGCIVNEQWFVL